MQKKTLMEKILQNYEMRSWQTLFAMCHFQRNAKTAAALYQGCLDNSLLPLSAGRRRSPLSQSTLSATSLLFRAQFQPARGGWQGGCCCS